MVDLGTWAAEDYRVAGGKAEDDSEHPDDRRKPGDLLNPDDRRKEDLLKKPNLN